MVDALVVNDNSGQERNPNVATLAASALAARDALHVERHPFVDFADMRNRAFAALRSLPEAPDWVLFLDADEVHGPELPYIAREILPRLGPGVARLDGYTYHFFGTFGWLTDVARRMMFFRYAPELHWVNPVHEKLVGLSGKTVVIPYVYYHYGNVLPPRMLAEKHLRYFALGNKVPRPPDAEEADAEVYLAKAAELRPFRGAHPPAARATVAALMAQSGAELAALDAALRGRRSRRARLASLLRATNEGLRVKLRHLERPWILRARRPAGTAWRRLENLERHERPTALGPSALHRAHLVVSGSRRAGASNAPRQPCRRPAKPKRPARRCRFRSATRRCGSASRCSHCPRCIR